MHARNRWPRAALLLLTALGAAACGGEPEETPPPSQEQPPTTQPAPGPGPAPAPSGQLPEGVTQQMVQQGRQVFTGPGLCFSCHAQDATGTPLAPDLTDAEWLWVKPDQGDVYTQIVTLVRTGVSIPQEYPAAMPAMGGAQLSEDQIAAVAAYVYSLSPQG